MRLLVQLRRFARAKTGLAALEFAILLPMMVLALFGSIDLIDTLNANKRAQNVTSSISDVVARDTEVSDAEVTGLWSAIDILMYPNTSTDMQIRVSSVTIPTADTATIVWSEGHGGYAPRAANSTVTLPAAMMNAGTSVIMTETIYNYHPPLGFLFPTINLTHTAYRRSRQVDPIPRVP